MDDKIEDFIFMEHFNPVKEPELMPMKECPFCGSKIHTMIEDKHLCFRCGRVWENKK